MLCCIKWKTETTQSVWCHRLFVSLPHFFFPFFFDSLSFCIPFIFLFVHRISWIWPLTQSYVIKFWCWQRTQFISIDWISFALTFSTFFFCLTAIWTQVSILNALQISYAKRALSIKHWAVSLFSAIPFNLMMSTVLWFTSALMVSIAIWFERIFHKV